MPRHDPTIALRQMWSHAREAIAMAAGKSRGDLDSERMLALALTHLVEIIGEAANRVSPEVQAQYPQIPWQQLIGMRNRLIHGYDQVDLDILWQVVASDLPALLGELETILPPE